MTVSYSPTELGGFAESKSGQVDEMLWTQVSKHLSVLIILVTTLRE